MTASLPAWSTVRHVSPPPAPAPNTASSSGFNPGAALKKRDIALFKGSTVGEWQRGQLIGTGASGAVYEAIDKATESYFAVKQIEFPEDFADNPEERKRFDALRAEVEVLQMVDHPNVVRFLGVDRVGFNMYIMMDFVAGGSIASIIKRFKRLPDTLAARYAAQLAAGLNYLHEMRIIHRDIKGANVLVSDEGVVKLADFGAARHILDPEQQQHTLAGTPYWMAPEVVRQEGHGASADVWSFGATVLQMLTGRAPYEDLTPVAALFHIGHQEDEPVPPEADLTPDARSFIQLCLNRDKTKRPSVAELQQHPWLAPRGGHVGTGSEPSVGTSLASVLGTSDAPSPAPNAPPNAPPLVVVGDGGPLPTSTTNVEENDVMGYVIALSFHHDENAAMESTAQRPTLGHLPAAVDDDKDDDWFNEQGFEQFVSALGG